MGADDWAVVAVCGLAAVLIFLGFIRKDTTLIYVSMVLVSFVAVLNVVQHTMDHRWSVLPVDGFMFGAIGGWFAMVRHLHRKQVREESDGTGEVVALGGRPAGDHRAAVPGRVLHGRVINRHYTED